MSEQQAYHRAYYLKKRQARLAYRRAYDAEGFEELKDLPGWQFETWIDGAIDRANLGAAASKPPEEQQEAA